MSTTDGLCVASKVVLVVNTQYSQSAVEDLFGKYLGCKKVVFPTPIVGDGTGHVDMFAKRGSDTTAMVGQYTAAQDAQSPGAGKNVTILDQDAALLAAATTPSGKTITVTRIPMPNWGNDFWGGYVRTYTNSQALQGASDKTVLIPVYSDETSNEAAGLAAYSTVFPGWAQVTVDAKDIISWGGAIHCVLMQIAAGTKAKMEPDPAAMCGNQLTCITPPTPDLGPEGHPGDADRSPTTDRSGDRPPPSSDLLASDGVAPDLQLAHDGRRKGDVGAVKPGGCSCEAAGRGQDPSLALLLLGLGLLAVRRRRR